MFGHSNSKIILQYNGKELTVRNTEIDMNFVKKGCRESNGELQGPRLCVQLAALPGFVCGFGLYVPPFSKVLSQSSLVSTKKTTVSFLDFSAFKVWAYY